MDLPNLLTKIKPPPEEAKLFLALEIGHEVIKSSLWQIKNRQTQIVSLGSIEEWSTQSKDDLVTAADASLSQTLAGIEKEPDEIIFGLSETWVSGEGIVESKKETLKYLCTKLNLKPVGFVVVTEALVHYLEDIEGGPLSAILLDLSPTEVSVSLIRLSKIEGTQVVGRSQDLASDVEEGLARFPQSGNLPARMILYNGHLDLENAKQTLISYDWQSKLPFLHFPKIESLDKDATIKAVSIAGGAEVAKSLGFSIHQPKTSSKSHAKPKTNPSPPPSPEPIVQNDTVKDRSQEFGFTSVAYNQSASNQATVKTSTPAEAKSEPDRPIDENINNVVSPEEPLTPEPIKPGHQSDQPTHSKSSAITRLKSKLNQLSPFKKTAKPITTSQSTELQSSKKFSPKLRLPSISIVNIFSKLPPLIYLVPAIFIILIISGIVFYWQVPKANIEIYISPKNIEKEIEFTLNPSINTLSLETNTIPGQKQTSSVTGEDSITTTGSKIVGERAGGKVTIFNRTTSPKTLSKGTSIQYQNLKFTLDSDTTIASASSKENSDFSVTIEPSQAEVNVTAVAIGAQYNLPQDTQFEVANFSSNSFVAKTSTAITGGSSREIQAVSEEDQENLKAKLLSQLQDQVVNQLSQETQGMQGVIKSDESDLIESEFSHDVGEEAQTLSLSMTVDQTAYIYDLTQLTMLVQQIVKEDIPQNLKIEPNATQVEVIQNTINEDDSVLVNAKVTLKLMPQLDTQEIIKNIRGKYPPATQDYFKSLPGFIRSQTTIKPTLPTRLNTYPRKADNININIQPIQP